MIQAMRDWLSDCDWLDADECDFASMPDWQVIRGVARWFDGGLTGFVRSYRAYRGV